MTETDLKLYWYYFRSLAKQLYDTEQYVDHMIDSSGRLANGTAFSNEFAKLLMLSAAEFEVIAKTLCFESGIKLPWNANIVRISREILGKFPRIGETIITTPYQTIQPLLKWNISYIADQKGKPNEKVEGLSWWNDYAHIKHDRRIHFISANLQNCVDALASLMVLELYLSRKAIGNVNEITSLGCEYFGCNYGMSCLVVNAGKDLPDFKKAE